MPAVTVNLDVQIDVNSGVTVFGKAVPTIANPIIADTKLSASALNGLIEFWEPSTAVGTIQSHLDLELVGEVGSQIASYKASAVSLYGGLKTVLAGNFDCRQAEPYKTDASGNLSYYSALGGFGKVALGQVAHAVFGHVAATAAITNDSEFVTAILAETAPASANWAAINAAVQSAAAPNLANALVKTLVLKGFSGESEIKDSNDASALTLIAEQVIGQDANRAKGQDNNAILPDVHQKLKFEAGDTVYMSITVKYPTVTLNSPNVLTPSNLNDFKKFDLKITLVA